MDDTLRHKVKLLKVYKNVSYKDLSRRLGIKTNSFYNWLRGEYSFSQETADRLRYIITEMDGK